MYKSMGSLVKHLPRGLGRRTMKTVFAVMLSAALMRYVFHETPFFACIGAAVAMERTIRESYRAALIRNLGTLVGGLLGILFAYLTGNVVFLALGVVLIITIQNGLNKQQSIIPACVVYFAVVYTNTADTALSYGLRRIGETFLGTLVAILVNYVLWPPRGEVSPEGCKE